MKIFDIILKLIKSLQLVDSNDYNQLVVDVKAWEETAVETSSDKMKAMYAKAHKGVWLRLLNPFLYFIVLRKMKDVMEGRNSLEDNFLDD